MQRIEILLEEYRVLYGLLCIRLATVDQRVPLVAGAVMAVLGSVSVLPAASRPVVLLAVPVLLSWLLRMTVHHARSKEDVLRRIDEIERLVNQLAGEELLTFQSRHPNRRQSVSGRTGLGAVSSVLAVCLVSLLGCLIIATQWTPAGSFLPVYVGYVTLSTLDLIHTVLRLRRYRYRKPAPVPPPLSRVLVGLTQRWMIASVL